MATTSTGSPEKDVKSPVPTTTKRFSLVWIVGAVVTFVVVALALGLGLGLGLRNKNNVDSSPAPAPTGSPLPGSGTAQLEDWRLDTKQYQLDMNWDLNAPPTTRHYDLVITEGQGWPDGGLIIVTQPCRISLTGPQELYGTCCSSTESSRAR